MPHLSVVIPVYNSAASIGGVVNDCFAALQHLDFELVLVNDGSTDISEAVIFMLAKKHPNIKAISLTKNFGEFNAVMCGLNFTTGEYTAIIDDDGQNPPQEILKLLAKAEEGYGVVYAKYDEKMHAGWRNLGSWLNNLLAALFMGKPLSLYLSSFKIIHRKLLDKILEISRGTGHPDSLLFSGYPKHSSVIVEHKSALIPSRYGYIKLTSTSLSMLVTGKNLPVILLLSLLLIPGLFFFAVVNLMSDSPIEAYQIYLFNMFLALLFVDIALFVTLLIATIYFRIKFIQLRSEYRRAKKSFNA
jgi:undecaprenyl-phosphate 4-deoxy-4-formamido-L-arabinose transferase